MTDFVRVLRDARAPDLEQPEGWQTRAACAGRWWLFDLDDIREVDDVVEALSICARCLVRIECETQRVEKAEHLQRNLVMGGVAWVAGKPWNPQRDAPPKAAKACESCGVTLKPGRRLDHGMCAACRWRQIRYGNAHHDSGTRHYADRYADWLELAADGYSKRAAAERMGTDLDTLNKAIRRSTQETA